VPTRSTRLSEALDVANRLRIDLGRDIRAARRNGGISQRQAGAVVAMSHAQFGRIERGELEALTIEQLSRACSAVGLRLVSRAVPDADPIVDSGQLALLARFRKLLPTGLRLETEVPFPGHGDRRAWDGLFRLEDLLIGVEAETRIRDVQALDRRCSLKLRDGGADVLILVVADTAWNRRLLDEHRAALRSTFPLDGRQIRPLLRKARAPRENGIVML
jgi:transcriptional regulator with XRE-family HTH domain